MPSSMLRRLAEVNGELWLILSLFVIALILNSLVRVERMALGFYVLPTVFSAYRYGRRHATLTAVASVCVVTDLTYFNPRLFQLWDGVTIAESKWFDIMVWGGTLIVIAYAMGTLYGRLASLCHPNHPRPPRQI